MVWNLCAMILTNAYTGNMLSHLLIQQRVSTINSLEDLLASSLQWVVRSGSSTEILFMVTASYLINQWNIYLLSLSDLISWLIFIFCFTLHYQDSRRKPEILLEGRGTLTTKSWTTFGSEYGEATADPKTCCKWEICLHSRTLNFIGHHGYSLNIHWLCLLNLYYKSNLFRGGHLRNGQSKMITPRQSSAVLQRQKKSSTMLARVSFWSRTALWGPFSTKSILRTHIYSIHDFD